MIKNSRIQDLYRKEAETLELESRKVKHFDDEVKPKKKSDKVLIYIALAIVALILLSFLLWSMIFIRWSIVEKR